MARSRKLNKKCKKCGIIVPDINKCGYCRRHISELRSNDHYMKCARTRQINCKKRGYWFDVNAKNKMSLAHIEYYKNHISHRKGVKFTDKHRKLISFALTGKKLSKEHLENMSKSLSGVNHPFFGKHHSLEAKEKNRIAHLGKRHKIESKRILRSIRIESIKNNFGICWPNYNKKFCDFCKLLDKKLLTLGDYACNGRGGEKLLKSLGYFPDYFNEELKLIIEYDESYHYKNGILREKDMIRQNEIKKTYPDFLFIRINAKTKIITII